MIKSNKNVMKIDSTNSNSVDNKKDTNTNSSTKSLNGLANFLKHSQLVKDNNFVVNIKKNEIKLQKQDKFIPETFCSISLNKDNDIQLTDILPLINFVQKEANQDRFIDDVKADRVKYLFVNKLNPDLSDKVSYQAVGAPWVTYPRKITFTRKTSYNLNDKNSFNDITVTVISFARKMVKLLNDIAIPNSEYFVYNKVKPVDKNKIIY